MNEIEITDTQTVENLNKGRGLMKTGDLIQVIYKLKHRYNELLQINSFNIKVLEQKRVEEFSFMRLMSNPLSETSSKFNISDEPSIQTNHDELVKKKQLITKNLNAEIESNSNVTYMIEQEKEKLLFLNEKLIEMKEKQRMIDAAKKELMKNENEALKKMKTGKTILSNLSSEVTRVKYLLHNQDNKINSLSDEINSKQVEIKRKKEEVKNLVKTLEIQTRNNKESLRKEMQNVKLMKDSKIAQERYCIKIILGLDLIKNHILSQQENPNFNQNILNSEDYKTFKSEKLTIIDGKIDLNNTIPNNQTNINKNSVSQKEEQKISLVTIKEKYDNLDINFDELYNFYSKMLNKQSFNHSYMMKYNDKQVQLEIKREKYSKKIHDLISKNYKNFDELIKSNSKLEKFINKFNQELRSENCFNKIYTFELESKQDKELINKSTLLFSEINSILDYIKSCIDEYVKQCPEKIEEDENPIQYLKEISPKIKGYFHNLSKMVKTEKYVELLFSEYLITNNKIILDCEKKTDFFEKINDSNKDRLFLDLQNFVTKEKNLFYSINISFEKDIFNKLNQSLKIVEIFEMLREICNSIKVLNDSFNKNLQIDSFAPVVMKKILTNRLPLYPLNEAKDNTEDSIEEDNNQIIAISNKTSHKKFKSISVAQSLYEPFIKRNYIKDISENFHQIKKNTVKNIKGNHILSKKQGEIKQISKQINILNNPKINLDNLSKNTYNDFMKKVVLNQKPIF